MSAKASGRKRGVRTAERERGRARERERARFDARARALAAFHAELRARFQIPTAPAEHPPSLIEILSREA